MYLPESRAAFQLMLKGGWTDALRSLHPAKGVYTYWNFSLRNRVSASRLEGGDVDVAVRGWDKPSDHAPAWIELLTTPGGND